MPESRPVFAAPPVAAEKIGAGVRRIPDQERASGIPAAPAIAKSPISAPLLPELGEEVASNLVVPRRSRGTLHPRTIKSNSNLIVIP
jgi:hypothetical protein